MTSYPHFKPDGLSLGTIESPLYLHFIPTTDHSYPQFLSDKLAPNLCPHLTHCCLMILMIPQLHFPAKPPKHDDMPSFALNLRSQQRRREVWADACLKWWAPCALIQPPRSKKWPSRFQPLTLERSGALVLYRYPLVNEHHCGKAPYLVSKPATNGHFQELCLITNGYAFNDETWRFNNHTCWLKHDQWR